MNLIGRLLLEILRLLYSKRTFDPFKTITRQFRVWPHDIDINIHLTAARYLSFGDLCRIAWMSENRILKPFLTQGYMGVVNAQEITYIREFKPFAKVTMETQLMCWDEKYGYFEQRFYCDGQIYAVAHVRMAVLLKRKVITLGQFFENIGYSLQSPDETIVIKDWKEMLSAKKEQFS